VRAAPGRRPVGNERSRQDPRWEKGAGSGGSLAPQAVNSCVDVLVYVDSPEPDVASGGEDKRVRVPLPRAEIEPVFDAGDGDVVGGGQVAEACREQLQPSSLSGLRTGESGAYGGEGGRMIAAISIGIIIIIAVIIAALAIIYFVLKGSPR